MSTSSQKSKLMHGMGSRLAKQKLAEIFKRDNPEANFNRVNKDFGKQYKFTLLAFCEIWHKLRSYDHTFDVVTSAFAEKVSRGNKHAHHLQQIIHAQKAELFKKDQAILRLKGQLNGAPSKDLKQESALRQTPQVAERENAEGSEANG